MSKSATATVTMEPANIESRRYWYGHGMSTDNETLGAGCAFRLLGVDFDLVVVEWRFNTEDGKPTWRAFMSEDGNPTRWELGSPRTIEGLRRAVAAWWNRSTVTAYRVTAPTAALPFPNEY